MPLSNPIQIPFFKWTLEAAGDLSAKQYSGLTLSGGDAAAAGAGVRILGVLQNKPSAAGQAAEIQSYGISKILLGATVAAGADIATDAAGAFVTAAGSDAVVGRCLVGGDAGEIGCALMYPGVAADPRNSFVFVSGVDISGGVSAWTVAPITGDIVRVRTVVQTALTIAAEPGAIALELATVLVVGSGVVIAAEAAAGDPDDSGAITPGGTTAVTAGDPIEITNDGVPTSGVVGVLIEFQPS